jgi:hypothetical protein
MTKLWPSSAGVNVGRAPAVKLAEYASAASAVGHAYREGTHRKTVVGREAACDVGGEGGHGRGGRVSAVRVWGGDRKWIS